MTARETIEELARTRRAFALEAARRPERTFGGTSADYWAGMADAYDRAADALALEAAAAYVGPERRRTAAERTLDLAEWYRQT